MSRKNRAPKRDVLPDPLYNSQLVTRLINRVMLDGKRGTAASIVYGALSKSKKLLVTMHLKYLKQLWKTSCLYLKYVHVVLVVLTTKSQLKFVQNVVQLLVFVGWLTHQRARGEHTMKDRLAKEIMDAANNTGASVKKREDTHKMAEANRAFAHFRW